MRHQLTPLTTAFILALGAPAFAQNPAPALSEDTAAASGPAAPEGADSSAADAPPPVDDPQADMATAQASEPPPVAEPTAAPLAVDETSASSDQASAPDAASESSRKSGPTYQHSLYLGSPIWMSNAPLDPGFEFEIRDGIKLGALVPELGFGMRWNWTNVDKIRASFPDISAPQAYAGENLHGFWLSLGLRVEPEVKGKVTPYGSVAFDAIMWGASFDRSEVCGIWSCGSVRNYDFAPGFSGRAGIRIAPKPFIGIDLGAKVGMSFPGWAFQDTQSWLEPYAGLTIITGAKSADR